MGYDLRPLLLTFKLAFFTTVILFIAGIPLAYWLVFTKNRIRYLAEVLVSMPLVLPSTVIGFYLLVFFSPRYFMGNFLENVFNVRIVFTFTGLVIGSVIYSLPFMVNPIKSAFQSFPVSLIEASYTLGKSKFTTLLQVILPNIKPSLLSGVAMTFAHTVGEFGVVLMIGGSIPGVTRVASIAVYGETEVMHFSAANFYSVVLIAVSFTILMFLSLVNRKKPGFNG
jgi:molybdate transport system permease protein